MKPFYTEAFVGPQADDIGMQFIYGKAVRGRASESVRAGPRGPCVSMGMV